MSFKGLFLCVLLIAGTGVSPLVAQMSNYCVPGRFSFQRYFYPNQIVYLNDVVYGEAPDYLGQNVALTLDLAYPSLLADNLPKRPLLLMIHGGGMIQGDKGDLRDAYNTYVAAGYVVANINYRLGRTDSCHHGPSHNYVAAIYRATQDAHAALRYLCSKADSLGIDPEEVFVFGNSAGAMTAFTLAFIQQHEVDDKLPELRPLLGRLDSSGNNHSANFKLKGLIALWGSILDTAFITHEDAIPVMLIHGTADNIVPYDTLTLPSCNPHRTPVVQYGSLPISQRLQHLESLCQLHVKQGAGHGGSFSRNFWRNHTTCFVNSVLCDNCHSFINTDFSNYGCVLPVTSSSGFYNQNGALSLFPNPTNNYLEIKGLPANTQADVAVVNTLGVICKKGKIGAGHRLDVSQLATGTYILQVFSSHGLPTQSLSFIKQ